MRELKIGDRVKATLKIDNKIEKNSKGTIVGIDPLKSIICITWDNWNDGHSGSGFRTVQIPLKNAINSCWNIILTSKSITFIPAQLEFDFNA